MNTEAQILKQLKTIKVFIGIIMAIFLLLGISFIGSIIYSSYIMKDMASNQYEEEISQEELDYQRVINDSELQEILHDKYVSKKYAKYLQKDDFKSFATTRSGTYGYSSGKFSQIDADYRALKECEDARNDWESGCIIIDQGGNIISPIGVAK